MQNEWQILIYVYILKCIDLLLKSENRKDKKTAFDIVYCTSLNICMKIFFFSQWLTIVYFKNIFLCILMIILMIIFDDYIFPIQM